MTSVLARGGPVPIRSSQGGVPPSKNGPSKNSFWRIVFGILFIKETERRARQKALCVTHGCHTHAATAHTPVRTYAATAQCLGSGRVCSEDEEGDAWRRVTRRASRFEVTSNLSPRPFLTPTPSTTHASSGLSVIKKKKKPKAAARRVDFRLKRQFHVNFDTGGVDFGGCSEDHVVVGRHVPGIYPTGYELQ